MAATDLTVAVDKRGRTTPLGDFVFGLLEAKGMSVSEFARRSQLSRSFLYLLRDDKQVPSLDTLVTLFRALEVDDVRVADVGEPGDLALAGVPPLSAAGEALLVDEWERLRLEAPVGLFGPSQLSLPSGAPDEERRLADAFYARTRSRSGDAAWLLRAAGALFTARAWAPEPEEGE